MRRCREVQVLRDCGRTWAGEEGDGGIARTQRWGEAAAYPRPHSASARAVFSGSFSSAGGGVRFVFTCAGGTRKMYVHAAFSPEVYERLRTIDQVLNSQNIYSPRTAQKRQPRVHVSPRSITVAVPVSPFQHCK